MPGRSPRPQGHPRASRPGRVRTAGVDHGPRLLARRGGRAAGAAACRSAANSALATAGRDRRRAGLADAARASRVLGTMWTSTVGISCMPQHRVVVEVGLQDAAVLERELAVERRGEAEGDAGLHLGLDAERVDADAAVDGADHAVHLASAPSSTETSATWATKLPNDSCDREAARAARAAAACPSRPSPPPARARRGGAAALAAARGGTRAGPAGRVRQLVDDALHQRRRCGCGRPSATRGPGTRGFGECSSTQVVRHRPARRASRPRPRPTSRRRRPSSSGRERRAGEDRLADDGVLPARSGRPFGRGRPRTGGRYIGR